MNRAASSSNPLNSPNLLNYRYKILKPLAEGGFGKTFLAEDTQMPSRRRCVIKQLKPVSTRPEIAKLVQERFTREAAVLDEVGKWHSQIPSLYAYFVLQGQFYLVQEWIDGEPLFVSERRRWSQEKVRQLLIDLLDAIAHIHRKNIIHRDIKPDNIILRTSDQLPCLIDFGAVKELMTTVMEPGGLPKSSIIIGTPGYMPEEQAAGRPTFASDLYSLGMTAICLLTGQSPAALPVDARTGSLLWQHHAPNLDRSLAQLLSRSVHPQAQSRFSSATDMLSALSNSTDAPNNRCATNKAASLAMTLQPPSLAANASRTVLSNQSATVRSTKLGPVATSSPQPFRLRLPFTSFPFAWLAAGAATLGGTAFWMLRPVTEVPPTTNAPTTAAATTAATTTVEATDAEPESAQAYLDRAMLLYEQNKGVQSLQDAESAIIRDPTLIEAFILKGDVLANQTRQDLPGAIEAYSQALAIDINNTSALDRRCKAYVNTAQWALAEQDCSSLLSLEPDNADIYERRGDIRREQQDYSGAIADYSDAVTLNTQTDRTDKNQPIYWARSQAYKGRGEANQSADDMQKALDDIAAMRAQ